MFITRLQHMPEELPDPFTPIDALRRRRFRAIVASMTCMVVGTVAEKWAITQDDQTLPMTLSLLFIGSFIGLQDAATSHDQLQSIIEAKDDMIDRLVYEIQSAE